jgi:hypothetical protein
LSRRPHSAKHGQLDLEAVAREEERGERQPEMNDPHAASMKAQPTECQP